MKTPLVEIQFNGKAAYIYMPTGPAGVVENITQDNILQIIEAFGLIGFDVLLHRIDTPEQFFESKNEFLIANDTWEWKSETELREAISGFSNPDKKKDTIMCNVDGYVIPKGKL